LGAVEHELRNGGHRGLEQDAHRHLSLQYLEVANSPPTIVEKTCVVPSRPARITSLVMELASEPSRPLSGRMSGPPRPAPREIQKPNLRRSSAQASCPRSARRTMVAPLTATKKVWASAIRMADGWPRTTTRGVRRLHRSSSG